MRDVVGEYDIAVIGGGINGAGIARDAALRGFKVILLEKSDFGGGTTAWSSRLIHGGLRYLEYAEIPLVFESLQTRYPGKRVVLLGHSMGSYVAQSYAMRFGNDLAALILSGSTWPARMLVRIGRLLALIESWRHGKTGASALLDQLGFGDFNKKFEPARTELDWLSRDAEEVDRYVADPLCGGPYSTGLWRDLLGGLLEISKDAALRKIPGDLPILITGGAEDPVGGATGMQKLISHYEATEHRNVNLRVYADGRHEMLNEINRDEFTTDLLRWIETVSDA